jgi:hypothetical protein
MDGEGDLVENEDGTDTESDDQEIDADVAGLERDFEHSADEREHAAHDHVMQMDLADSAAAPATDARESGVERGYIEREKRSREIQKQRLRASARCGSTGHAG